MSDHTSRLRAADPSAVVGAVLGGYRVSAELSTGGMGSVYRAEHELLGKPAAVKLLRPEYSANPEMVERFFNEARAATAIRHPGIVEVFDFGYAADGRAYLVMEFLDGETLSSRLSAGHLSEVAAAVIVRGIASALAAAHAKGIIHRDLKPDNVFLVPDPDMPSGERPKVLDFGIAKLTQSPTERASQTRAGELMGTPAYMAPEQARAAGEIDHRADLYSLGCILYELLVGQPPFVSDAVGELIALQLFGEPEPPRARVPELSEEMERIVLRLLAKDPAARFATCADLSDALSAAMPTLSGRLSAVLPATSGRRPAVVIDTVASLKRPAPTAGAGVLAGPALTTPPSPGRSTPARRRRSPVGLALAAGAVVAAAVVGYVAVRGGATARPTAPPVPAQLPGPPVPTPTPAPGPAPAPTPTPSVTLFFRLQPASASVRWDGQPLPLKNGVASVPHDGQVHQVEVSAPDHQPATVAVTAGEPQLIQVELVGLGGRRRDRPRISVGQVDPVGPVGPPTSVGSTPTGPRTTPGPERPAGGAAGAGSGAGSSARGGAATPGSGSAGKPTTDKGSPIYTDLDDE